MSSAIDPTQPPEGEATTAAVRANFDAAKTEIEALQAAIAIIQPGGTLPMIALTTATAPLSRIVNAASHVYQRFPGALYAIDGAADDAFVAEYPTLAAVLGSPVLLSSTNINTPYHCNIGIVGTKRLGIFTGTVSDTNVNAGFHAPADTLSPATQLTATAITGSAAADPINDVMFSNGTALIATNNATNSKIRRSTDGSTFSTVGTLLAAISYRLAQKPDASLLVAIASTVAAAGNIRTSTDGITWTSRTPSGATGPAQAYVAFWCPAANAGAGAFIFMGSTKVWRSTDGYTVTASADHGIALGTPGYYSWQARTAHAADCTLFAFTNGIYRTTDGMTYERVSKDSPVSIWLDGTTFHALTDLGYHLTSDDNGLTFQTAPGVIMDSLNAEQTNGRSLIVGASRSAAAGQLYVGFRANVGNGMQNAALALPDTLGPTHIGALRASTTADVVYSLVRIS